MKHIVIIVVLIIISGTVLIFASEEYRCEATGGHWGKLYPIDEKYCNPSTSDSGKECTDVSQCEGFCQAKIDAVMESKESGTCSEYTLYSGCTQEIMNGTVFGPWCY